MTKLKSRYLTCETYNCCDPVCFEHPKGESMTVVGDSYSVKELFDRYLKGQVVNVERETFWEDTKDFDAIDFQALKHADPFEKEQLLLDVKAKAEKAAAALSKWKKEQEALKDSASSSDEVSSKPSSKPKNQSQSDSEDGEPVSKRSGANDANSSERKNS